MFYENRVKDALDDPSKTVGVTTVRFMRSDPSSIRPDSLRLSYTIDDKVRTVVFKNEAKQIPEIINRLLKTSKLSRRFLRSLRLVSFKDMTHSTIMSKLVKAIWRQSFVLRKMV